MHHKTSYDIFNITQRAGELVFVVVSKRGLPFADEFNKMKDGVPPALIDEHVRNVKQAAKEGRTTDPGFELEKTAIAGASSAKTDSSGQSK